MKVLRFFLALAVLVMAGCASNKKLREEEAFRKGQQLGIEAQKMAEEPAVWFRGQVRNLRVPWHENLTLTQALVAADYTGALDPRRIYVIRQGQTYKVDPKRLVLGLEDPPLEAGDVVEITR